ncbi:MAG: hypothetical protein E6L04_08280 [Thaumarchaeota archaeon]|nr:MAG: hypothetical protein E6L04_08280 [Nitrososphaerota archaeon]TLX87007.1 MAG: hypothetical protein E6K97_09715 [Nitrososphaerota archaeon]
MNLDSKTLLVPSIVLIIGAVIGASAASVFADDPFKSKVLLDLKENNKSDCNGSVDGGMNGSCQIETSHDIDILKVYSNDTRPEP